MSSINNDVSEILMNIGKNVKRLRKERGFTQLKLAILCDEMEPSLISKIETFQCSGLTIGTLARLSKALEVDIMDLFKKEIPPA